MKESHLVLWGDDVLADLKISREHLRLRCEQELKNLLLSMPRHYFSQDGSNLSSILARMIVGFLEMLRVAISLEKGELPPRNEVIRLSAQLFELDEKLLSDVKDLHDNNTSHSRKEIEKLYDMFMANVNKTAQVVGQMN